MGNLTRHDMKKYISRPPQRISLLAKLTIMTAVLITGTLLVLGLFFYQLLADSLEEQMGERALSMSRTVSEIPELQEEMGSADPSAEMVQVLIAPLHEASEAEFIVVGDTEEIRYSHPNPDRLGERMVGEDNERALALGESYISQAEGSLGPSIRGKTPLISDGEIVGVVSVGFLMEDVRSVVGPYRNELLSTLALITAFGAGGAWLLSRYIKRRLFQLEPEEISYLLLQKETMLQSAYEGIIAVNREGKITLMNRAAQKLVKGAEEASAWIGRPIQEVLPLSRLPEVLETGVAQYDEEMAFGANVVLVNRVPMYDGDKLIGAVSTFRNKTEIEKLSNELARVREYAEGLRAQTHEFSNKLHTISGLLQLEEIEKAKRYIKEESVNQKNWIRRLIHNVKDPMLSAILLGKLNLAHENGVKLEIDESSHLAEELPENVRQALITAVGNIIDNAIEAMQELPRGERLIEVYFSDAGQDVLIEVEDVGPGIPETMEQSLFEQGVSSKSGEGRGFGLALSKAQVEACGGTIFAENTDEGTCFVVTIPKQRRKLHG
ncbi:ATP-binding protein [Bacillus daqingensis]|uniref:histidine kinase n=2 Tax=Bacillus daqingensis TaxID=872396 RepID=A0ABV9NZ30_9BACI